MINLSIRRLSEKEFLDVKHEWNSLLEKSVTNEVFLLWEWMYSWWEVFKDASRELYLLRGKNPMGETIGIAPFYLQKQTLFGTHKRNIIRFCSSLETYPDHLDIIAMKEYEHLFSEAVLKYLIQNDKDWDLIKLDGVHENSILKKYLTSTPTKGKGLIMTSTPDSKCPYLVIDKSFEDYLRSFSPKKRQTLLRKRRILLEREKAIFKTVRCDEEPEKYILELFALHGERARQKGIRTTFSGENIYTFHNKVIHSLLKDSKVVLAFLYKGVNPLVSYYCIKHNKKVYYYQAGLSQEGEKRSAGTVLFSLLLEDAFEERYKEFDFLRGSEEYKYFWTKNYRENYSITLRKNDLSNRMAHYIHTLYRGARSRFQRIYKPGRTNAKAGSKGVEFIRDVRCSVETLIPPEHPAVALSS
jgi:CelD/BcsL family acetyltransferase involved in cellulose biosynthesis